MKKKLFKNKIQMVTYLILYLICIGLFIVIGNIEVKNNSLTEALKFSNIYKNVDQDNLYVFANATDVLNVINGRSGVVLFGFPQNKWTSYYAEYLDEVAKEVGIDKIYYYNFLSDRDESNGTYETIVNHLAVYVPTLDEGMSDIMAPTILVVKDGEILIYYDETSIIKGNVTPEVYFDENQIIATKELLKNVLEEYVKQVKYGRQF